MEKEKETNKNLEVNEETQTKTNKPLTGEEVVIGTEISFLSESMTAYMHGAGIIPGNYEFVAKGVVDCDDEFYFTKGEFVEKGAVQ